MRRITSLQRECGNAYNTVIFQKEKRLERFEARFEDDQRIRREQVPEDTFPKFLRNNLNDAVQYGRLPYRNGLRIGPALMPNQA